jgi:hypothetical protein
MIGTMDCSEARISLGVYVLGAIDPAERALVDSHLETCRDCREELAELDGLPALLAKVSAEEAMALASTDVLPLEGDGSIGGSMFLGAAKEPPPELLGTVLDLTTARRRRRRFLEVGLGIAAALIVAVGVFGGLRLGSSPAEAAGAAAESNSGPASGPWQTVTTSAQGMSATVGYRSMGWGTQLAVKVNGIPIGVSCQLWVVGPNGSKTLAGGWKTDAREGLVWYPASAGLASTGISGFQVTVGTSGSLVLRT